MTQSAAKLMAAAYPGQARVGRLLRVAIRFPIAGVVVLDAREALQWSECSVFLAVCYRPKVRFFWWCAELGNRFEICSLF
jgi:hypothetical protein